LELPRIFVGFRFFTFAFLLEMSVANTLFFGLLRLSIIEYSYNLLIIKNNKAVNMLKTTQKTEQSMTGRKGKKRETISFPRLRIFVGIRL
jgi:hypothetical protein